MSFFCGISIVNFVPQNACDFAVVDERKKGGWNIACPKFPCIHHVRESCQCFLARHFKDWQEISSLLESMKSHPAAVVGWWSTQTKPCHPHFNSPLATEWRRKLSDYSADTIVNISFKRLQLNKTRRRLSVPLEFHQVWFTNVLSYDLQIRLVFIFVRGIRYEPVGAFIDYCEMEKLKPSFWKIRWQLLTNEHKLYVAVFMDWWTC